MNKKVPSRCVDGENSKWRGIGLCFGVFLLCASVALAQLTTGTITGTVTDQSGAATPGAAITVKDVETGIARTAITGSMGRYEVSNLPVGHYEVSAALSGFRTSVRSGIELSIGRTAVVDLALQVGAVAQAVTVAGEAPLVETSTATISNLVDEKRVEDLPLNNRDLTQLTYLQPGVIRVPQGTGQDPTGGLGDKLSVAGSRVTQNLYMLDGVSNSDQSGNAQGVSGSYIGAETVKEFQIITSNFSAEYKSAAGAIVSAVTKSGTNSFHGSAFEYLRNSKLDAANFFDNAFGVPKPAFKRNQFGGSLGGPIQKDKTFFFGSYEGLRERLGRTSTARIWTVAAKNGALPGGPVNVNAGVAPYLALYPDPGVGNTVSQNFGDGTVQVAGTSQQPTNDDFAAVRIDHQFSSGKAGSLSGTYNYDHDSRTPTNGIFPFEGGDEGSHSGKDIVSIRHTSILSSTALSEFIFGYSFTDPETGFPLTTHDFGNLVFIPGRKFPGDIAISGVNGVGFRAGDTIYKQKELNFKEGLSLTRGKHSLRMGAEIHRFRYDYSSITQGYYGSWTFNSLAAFLTAVPAQFQALVPGGDDLFRNITQLLPGFYFQDNYAVLPSLTLNLGLRYEFVTLPHETNGKVSRFVNITDPAVIVGGNYYSNATLKSFSPRFGFAWAPGSKNTSVRGGFGIFYDFPMLNAVQTDAGSMPPYIVLGTVKDTDAAAAGTTLVFPNAYAFNAQLLKGTPAIRAVEVKQKNAYIYKWNLTLQQQLAGGLVVSAGYTGTRALHLWQQSLPNLNQWQGYPNQPTGPKFFPAGAPRINSNFATSMRMQFSDANSYYNGLTLSAQKPLRHGLQVQASYTFSKATDQGSGIVSSGENLTSAQRGIYYWDMNLKKGLSAFDIRNSFVTNFSYTLPVGQKFTGISGEFINGWQLNGILSISSGYPLTLTDSSSAQNTRIGSNELLTVNLNPDGNSNPTSGTTVGCAGVTRGQKLGTTQLWYDPCQFSPSTLGFFGTLGRNTLISPGLSNFDFSLFKDFKIMENSRLQFRAELFNLLNHANFGSPVTTPYLSSGQPNAAAGQITSTGRNVSRQIQLALKYVF